MTPPRGFGKPELRALLGKVSSLGGSLASHEDDGLDDADLGLDSLAMIWLVTQLERRTGLPVSHQVSMATLFSVNTIHAHLLRCAPPDDHAG